MLKKILAFVLLLFANPIFANAQTIVQFDTFGIYYVEYEGEDMIFFRGMMELYSGIMIRDAMEAVNTQNLLIDSTGGMLSEGYVIGRYIDENDVNVYIPENGVCISACAYAVMMSDYIENNGKGLFFHAPYLPIVETTESIQTIVESNQQMVLEMTRWFIDAGYSMDLLELIFGASNRNTFIVFENIENLEEFKVNQFSQRVEIKPEWFKIEER